MNIVSIWLRLFPYAAFSIMAELLKFTQAQKVPERNALGVQPRRRHLLQCFGSKHSL
jgi:hypothetical protein